MKMHSGGVCYRVCVCVHLFMSDIDAMYSCGSCMSWDATVVARKHTERM